MSVVPSAKGFGRKLEGDVSGEVTGAGRSMGKAFGTAFKVGALALVAGAALTGKFLKGAIDEAREAQVVTARTENVIKSMGLASKVTASQVADLAGAISAKTGIDDEAIQAGQNLLLTFKGVASSAGEANGVFAQASRLMVDLAAGMGKDAKGAAIQLGKALNDPVKGVTALTRTGIQFTEQQKEQIAGFVETGQVAKAQAIILREVQKQFGGAAEAMATPAMKAQVAWANFKEEIGTRLLPVVDRVLTAFTGFLPTLLGRVDKIGPIFSSIVDAISPVVSQIRDFMQPVLDKVGAWIKENPAFVKAFAIALGVLVVAIGAVTLATAAFSLALNSTGIPLLIIGIAALAASLYVAYQRSETFRNIVDQVGASIRSFATFVRDEVVPTVVSLAQKVGDHLKPVLSQLGTTFKNDILPTVQKVIAKFREWQPTIEKVIGVVVQVTAKVIEFAAKILGTVLPPLIRLSGFIISNIVPAFLDMTSRTGTAIGKMVEFGKAVVDRVQDFQRFVTSLKQKMAEGLAFLKSVPARAANSLGDLGGILLEKGRALIQGFIDGMSEKLQAVKDKAAEIAGAIKGFFPGSPVKEGPLTSWNNGGAGKTLMGLLAKGIADGSDEPSNAMEAAAQKIHDRLVALRDRIKSTLDGLKSDFASLRDGIASAFNGDLFQATNATDFIASLTANNGMLDSLKKAFGRLRKFGLDPAFISQLFSQGGADLILDLASSKGSAQTAEALFGVNQSLASSLGTTVARNEFGPEIDRVVDRLERIEKAVRQSAREMGREINGVAATAARSR